MEKISPLQYIADHTLNFITGIFFWLIAYFADISGSIHVMAAAFAIDLTLGIVNSVWKNKKKFQMKKVFIQFYYFIYHIDTICNG